MSRALDWSRLCAAWLPQRVVAALRGCRDFHHGLLGGGGSRPDTAIANYLAGPPRGATTSARPTCPSTSAVNRENRSLPPGPSSGGIVTPRPEHGGLVRTSMIVVTRRRRARSEPTGGDRRVRAGRTPPARGRCRGPGRRLGGGAMVSWTCASTACIRSAVGVAAGRRADAPRDNSRSPRQTAATRCLRPPVPRRGTSRTAHP